MEIAHLVMIRYQIWPPQAILVSDWLISKKTFFSGTARPNELKFGRKHLWKVSIRGKDFLEINQSETRIACGGHVYTRIGTK
jgi:hypothetical protein